MLSEQASYSISVLNTANMTIKSRKSSQGLERSVWHLVQMFSYEKREIHFSTSVNLEHLQLKAKTSSITLKTSQILKRYKMFSPFKRKLYEVGEKHLLFLSTVIKRGNHIAHFKAM